MRRILQMVMEVAQQADTQDNVRNQQLREAYDYIDQELDFIRRNDTGPQPVSIQRLREALVVGDFPNYLGRTISVKVLDRYTYRYGQWRDYTAPDSLPTYNNGDRYRFSEFDRPVKRREKQEPTAGYIYEELYHIGVDDYSKQIDFSHRILVNDDLGAFNNLTTKMGDSARRFEDFYVSALYDNAVTQAWLGGLGVNYAGTGALTTANLAIGWNAFTQRVDGRGNPLNIVPRYLVIPPIARLTANQILESERIAELATNARNVLRGALEVREDPYIAFALPNIPWYLFADPADVPAVSVVRLDGKPDIELFAHAPDKIPMNAAGGLGGADWRLGSFLTGDIEIEVESTIGARTGAAGAAVGVTDAQGIYYSNGTTA